MKKLILSVLVLVITVSCKTINKDNEQIKNTVNQYFKAVKNNDLSTYSALMYNSEKAPGGIASDLFFLHKNYSKINPNNILLKNIKIKDTVDIGVHQKYIMFTLKKPNYKPFETNQDLKMYIMFWKEIGYNKRYQMYLIGDTPKWED